MHLSSPSPSPQTLWSRFAAFLSFVAVLSSLLTPITMLAEEVRTGKLGGICRVTTSLASQNAGDIGNGGGVSQTGSHCDLCGSLTLAPPPLPASRVPALPTSGHLAVVDRSIVLSTAIPGLPPSRGPPSLL